MPKKAIGIDVPFSMLMQIEKSLPCLFWASEISFYCILVNLVETELFYIALSSQNALLWAWYQTSEGQYKNSVANQFLNGFFSTSFAYNMEAHLDCTRLY